MVKGKVYKVKWLDHFSTDEWLADASSIVGQEEVLESVGFYLGGDKKYIHLTMTKCPEIYKGTMSIIKKEIIDIKELS